MTYTKSQNFTNTVVGELGIQTFKVVVIIFIFLLLSFDTISPTHAHPLFFVDKWFLQIYLSLI